MPSKQPIESQMIQWFRMAVKNDPGSARLMYALIRGEMAGLLKRGPKPAKPMGVGQPARQ